MEIRIVGSITDEHELDQIQSIAKIVVYEQRMKHFHIPNYQNKNLTMKFNKVKKHPSKRYVSPNALPFCGPIRGFV